MAEVSAAELLPSLQKHPISESMGIPEKQFGKPIGTLIMCGQGPVQDSATKVKLESLDTAIPDSVSGHEANTWMSDIARATGELNREGDIGLIVPSGRNTGGKYVAEGKTLAPTEAQLMKNIIENAYGGNAQIELEQAAKNTLFNVINAANVIDARRVENPNDPNLDNVWLIGSQFHCPRIKILASLFGFDPSHVLSAEKVLTTASQIKQQQGGGVEISGFDRHKLRQRLINVRLSGEPINERGQNYFQRKQERARRLLDRKIDNYLAEKDVSEQEMALRKEEIGKKLFIEEQKDAQVRMKDERRWARGLVMEADYVLPYAVYLKSDDRLRNFLLKFDGQALQKYGIGREFLENINPQTLTESMRGIRAKIDPNRWSWQVVKEEWKNEEYPPEVKERLASLNIPENIIENLSKADVPPVGMEKLQS